MALSTQNKAFLSVLHKLDIDLNQFPDQSFDGLFDNIPEDINYFFEWFIENITSDNILTKLEEANYFELENNDLLPTEEEMEYILSTRRPTYQELQNVDVNYVKSFLSEDLEDIKKTNRDFINIQYKIA